MIKKKKSDTKKYKFCEYVVTRVSNAIWGSSTSKPPSEFFLKMMNSLSALLMSLVNPCGSVSAWIYCAYFF